jgi:predicted phage-related endonuclease
MSRKAWDEWNNKIPQQYYIQILHYMLVTDFEFFVCAARLKSIDVSGNTVSTTRHYFFERTEVKEDLQLLQDKEMKFWESVTSKRRPSAILNLPQRKIIGE